MWSYIDIQVGPALSKMLKSKVAFTEVFSKLHSYLHNAKWLAYIIWSLVILKEFYLVCLFWIKRDPLVLVSATFTCILPNNVCVLIHAALLPRGNFPPFCITVPLWTEKTVLYSQGWCFICVLCAGMKKYRRRRLTAEEQLITDLFRGYDTDARAVINTQSTVTVTVQFLLLRIQRLVSPPCCHPGEISFTFSFILLTCDEKWNGFIPPTYWQWSRRCFCFEIRSLVLCR